MRCLCGGGRSKSYIVTTPVKAPTPAKVSVEKVVTSSGENGIASNVIRENDRPVTTTTPPITNGVGTTQTTITQVQIHKNHNEEVTRYQDTSKMVAQEFTTKSTSNNSTTEGTSKKSRAPQPLTSEIQVISGKGSESHPSTQKQPQNNVTSHNATETQVTPHKTLETHETSQESLDGLITNHETSETKLESHVTVHETPDSQLTSQNTSASHIVFHTLPKDQEISHKSDEINIPSSSQGASLVQSSHTSVTVTSHQETSKHTSSTLNESESEIWTEPVVYQETTTHTTSIDTGPKSEISSLTTPVTQETTIYMTSAETDSKPEKVSIIQEEAGSKSESSITLVADTKHETTIRTSAEITSKPEAPVIIKPITSHETTIRGSKSETSLLTIPSPTNTLSNSSSLSSIQDLTRSSTHLSLESTENYDSLPIVRKGSVGELITGSNRSSTSLEDDKRRSGVQVSIPTGPEVTGQEELPLFKKSPEDEEKIRKAIEKNEFLSKILSGKRLQDIINAMQPKNVISKQKLIRQGEKGSEMFVSKEGMFKVLIKGKVVGEFHDSRVFGELAILYKAKRLASIQAATTGKVWVLDRDTYQKIVISDNLREQDENLKFLQNVESLNVVNVDVLRQVVNLLKPEFFVSGTVIIRQGDKGDKFYIIRAGTVAISKTGEGVLGKLGKGQCFGEMALQKEDTRQATVTSEAPGVECLTLTRADFINHFGDVEIPKISVAKISFKDDTPSEYQDIKLEDLKIIKTLGVGGFGRVELVQHKKKKDHIFALKYLKKIDIVYQNQQEHVYNEKLIQTNCKSPFIVRMYRTYKDSKYVYFLMESCLGGDLFSLLHKQKGKKFEEKDARFISACVLEALEHLHSKGVVYRALKPENLLIDKNGYIKLTDFGFAKKMPARGKTFTFAGTPEYVALEIILNRGHDKAVDYWALGVFIFELLTGRTPFRISDSSYIDTYKNILNGIDNVNFPTYMNSKARNLIEKLCRLVPAERLGMQRGGTKDIKAHKWYQGLDFIRFQQYQIPSPFKPKLKDVTDTNHVNLFKQDKDYPPDKTSGWDSHF